MPEEIEAAGRNLRPIRYSDNEHVKFTAAEHCWLAYNCPRDQSESQHSNKRHAAALGTNSGANDDASVDKEDQDGAEEVCEQAPSLQAPNRRNKRGRGKPSKKG